MDIYKIIDDRLKFSNGFFDSRNDDLDYVSYTLNEEANETGLIFLKSRIDSPQNNRKFIKDLITSDWYIGGIFDLSSLISPSSSVKFHFYWLTKNKPENVIFSLFKGEKTYSSAHGIGSDFELMLQERVITEPYKQYLDLINMLTCGYELSIINKPYKEFIFFEQHYEILDLNNLSISYYSPEMIENRLKLKQETTQPLSELTDILFPKQIKDKIGKVCKPRHLKNLSGCLQSDTEKATDVLIQAGDILVARMGNLNFSLVEHDFAEQVFASNHFIVIRPKNDSINSEFLYLYLKSDTAQKYFLQFETGIMSHLFTKEHVNNLPIIIPDKNVLSNAKSLFQALYKDSNPDRVEIINKELFNTKIPEKPFQKDLIQEILSHLQIVKQHFIREVIEGDLSEIDVCINAGAYKSALILSGSVLEGVLLDWLSEIDKVDYINSKTHKKMLGEIISELKQSQHLTAYLIDAAFKISGYRNIVHPKVFLQKRVNLDRVIAEEILSDLRKILSKRLKDSLT